MVTYQSSIVGGWRYVVVFNIEHSNGSVDLQRPDQVRAAGVAHAAAAQLQRQHSVRLVQRLGQLADAAVAEWVVRDVDVAESTPIAHHPKVLKQRQHCQH
jgi:hypothetical protein